MAMPAVAQSVAGRSAVDGRPVELLSDGTWRYADRANSANCRPVAAVLEFCGSAAIWQETPPLRRTSRACTASTTDIMRSSSSSELGSDDGLTLEFMRKAVIQNVGSYTGVGAEDVPILDVTPGEVDGNSAETIAYQATVDGVPFVFVNTIFLSRKLTVQAVSYSVGTGVTDTHNDIHSRFLDATRIRLPAP